MIEIIIPFGASILIGALIGLERERSKKIAKGLSPIGVRSDILICLFGAISAFLGQSINPSIFAICLSAMLLFTISSHIYLSIRHDRIGVTTEISTILVFLLGVMTIYGYSQIAVILAILTTFVLSIRKALHRAIYNLKDAEVFDTLKFAIIAFIVLPFLPNKNYDVSLFQFFSPGQTPPEAFNQINVLNPYNIWFLVVMVSAISFIGYILVKALGKNKGIALTGMVGGLYSSTATSLTLAHKSKSLSKTKIAFTAGITLACAISFIKTGIEIKALNGELFNYLFIPIGTMFLYLLGAGLFLLYKSTKEKAPKESDINQFETPFSLKSAIKLGTFIIGALIISKILLSYTNIQWYYLIAAFMSVFAVDDPIIISTSASAGKLITFEHAKNVITMVIFLNMIQKVGLMYFFGNKKLVKPLAIIFGGLFLVTSISLLYF